MFKYLSPPQEVLLLDFMYNVLLLLLLLLVLVLLPLLPKKAPGKKRPKPTTNTNDKYKRQIIATTASARYTTDL